MELFDLADITMLRESIQRFAWIDRRELCEQVRSACAQLPIDGTGNIAYLFVVKFVPTWIGMFLPNVRVEGLADLPRLEQAIREAPAGAYQELWFCKTNVSPNHYSVAGRILVRAQSGFSTQTIEQVWRCSPRLIESLDENSPFPFVRASRNGWGWSPSIEHFHCLNDAPEWEDSMRREFAIALRHLDRIRSRLECFVEAVFAAGAEGCALEYKIEGDVLQIIDWDTAVDNVVLARLLPHD